MRKTFLGILASGLSGCAFAGTFCYDIESTTCSVPDISSSQIMSSGLVLNSSGSAKATYNYKITYTPDESEDVAVGTVTVSFVHMAAALGPNAVIRLDDSSDSASSGSSSTSTVTDPDTGLVLEHAEGADGGSTIPLSDDCWTDLSSETKTLTLTAQADGTYVGYVSIDTNTLTFGTDDVFVGELIQVMDIQFTEGS